MKFTYYRQKLNGFEEELEYEPEEKDVMYALADLLISDLPTEVSRYDYQRVNKFFQDIIFDYDLYDDMCDYYHDQLYDWFHETAFDGWEE